jgi:hypothetical protein
MHDCGFAISMDEEYPAEFVVAYDPRAPDIAKSLRRAVFFDFGIS